MTEKTRRRAFAEYIIEPQPRAVSQSIARKRQSSQATEARMNFVLDEQTKLRRRLNAPVAKLLASEMHQEVVRSSFDRYNNEIQKVHTLFPDPPSSDDLESEPEKFGAIGPPFVSTFVIPDTSNRSDGNFVDASGDLLSKQIRQAEG